ncbi:MAG: Ig-like domain repeat protein [Lachnospiraceae bacterium]|nr:Ig-like domain repeat protein [Lachnospiraceae bacterium]
MRSMKGLFISFLMFAACALGWGVRVYADEPGALCVDIRSYDGTDVAVLPGSTFITSIPVTFIPQMPGSMYSISIDDGRTFGGYVPVENEGITLYPDDDTAPSGRWQIRFQKKEDETVTAVSETYKVSFDVRRPDIVFRNPEEVTGLVGENAAAKFSVSDESGIARITAKNGDDMLYEYHSGRGETKYDTDISFALPGKGEQEAVLTCTDMAGNSTALAFKYKIDLTPPEIHISGIENGECTGNGVIGIYTSGDPESFIDYILKRETGEEITYTEVTNAPSPVSLDLTEDGRYSLKAVAADASGRRSEEAGRDFVIDNTAPVIDIGGVYENADLRAAADLMIDVKENMFESSRVDITLTRRTPDRTDNIPLDSYNLEAAHDMRTVNIKSDGEYEIAVRATDGAGNTSEAVKTFRLDQTPPDISVNGISEGVITSKKPVLRFDAGEMFYDSTVMTQVLEKKDGGGYVPVRTQSRVMGSVRDHIDIEVDEEGQYRLTCTSSDRSGNTASSAVEFAVDYTPPVITGVHEAGNRFFRSFSLPGKLSALIKDSSPFTAGAYINDILMTEDDVVTQEGKYVLTVLAEDAAGNASEESAVFMVDHTAPQIVLSGFDREGNIRKGSSVTVSLLDGSDTLKRVTFKGVGVKVTDNKSASFTVDDYGEYDIGVTAVDEAGNVTDTVIHTSCYGMGEQILSRSNVVSLTGSARSDFDAAGLTIGLISVLTGTFGLTYREYLRH